MNNFDTALERAELVEMFASQCMRTLQMDEAVLFPKQELDRTPEVFKG